MTGQPGRLWGDGNCITPTFNSEVPTREKRKKILSSLEYSRKTEPSFIKQENCEEIAKQVSTQYYSLMTEFQ